MIILYDWNLEVVLLLNFSLMHIKIYKTEVDLINIFDEIKTMLSHKLYSACVSILIVENPSDLTKLLPSLL